MAKSFWSYVLKPEANDQWTCWPWTNSISAVTGSAQFKHEGHAMSIHRVAWLLSDCTLREGDYLHHHCGNRHCMNPEHMFVDVYPSGYSASTEERWPIPKLHCEMGHPIGSENTQADIPGLNGTCRQCWIKRQGEFEFNPWGDHEQEVYEALHVKWGT